MRRQRLAVEVLIGFSVLMSVAGQVSLKLGLSEGVPAGAGPLAMLPVIVRSPLLLLGFLLYGLGALSWVAALARVDLSYAYPLLALNFILITLVSRIYLHEQVPLLRWLGMLVICFGILLVAKGGAGQ